MDEKNIYEIQRHSAVQFDARVEKSEERDHWSVVLQYQNEGPGPWLVDLAHKVRLDLQDKKIDKRTPGEVVVPQTPGTSVYANDMLVNRMNGTQASIYFLGLNQPEIEQDASYTDVSESTVFLALFGPKAFFVAEKLTALDFLAPNRTAPFIVQGPFCHVPCQIVTLEKNTDGSGGILLSCSRGYAESMVEAILDSGEEFGLCPAGEERFSTWLQSLEK